MGCLPPINWCFLPSTVCSWRHAIESASFLHLTAGGLWVHGDGVGVAGRQAMPCNLSTQKRTNRVEDFVEEDFVEFMLSLLWLALGWLSDLEQPFKFEDLGNHGIPFGFLRDFPLISTKGPSSAPGSAYSRRQNFGNEKRFARRS